jgi:hypothetical protein
MAERCYKALGILKKPPVASLAPVPNDKAIFRRAEGGIVYPECPVFVFRSVEQAPSNSAFHPFPGSLIRNLVHLKIDLHVSLRLEGGTNSNSARLSVRIAQCDIQLTVVCSGWNTGCVYLWRCCLP